MSADGTERPDHWPEHYMANPDIDCSHYMMWDDGVYRCIYECGLVHDEPPERKHKTNTERVSAEKCGCNNCGCVGMRMPDSPGKYAFDDIGTATICVEESGDVVVHFPGVENV